MKVYLFFTRVFKWLLVGLIFLPAICVGLLIHHYSVDVCFWDEWGTMPVLLDKQSYESLELSDFFAQNNEHRLFFPRLIMLAVADCTYFNTRAEMAVTWLLGCICSFNLWRISQVTGWKDSNLGLALLAAANVLLFSLIGFEDWLWSFQIGFLLPLACLSAAVWVIPSVRPLIAFSAAFVLSIICTFSIASGFISWLIVLPLLLFPGGNFRWRDRMAGIILWFLGLVGSVGLYFHGFVKPPYHPSLILCLRHPATSLRYLTAYLGAPLARGTDFDIVTIAIIAGTSLVTLLIAVVIYLGIFWRDSALLARTLPWLMLALISLFSAFLTTVGRMGFGIAQALVSRYIPFSTMLPIALLFLIPAVWLHCRDRVPRLWAIAGGWFFSSLALLAIGSSVLGSYSFLTQWQSFRKDRLFERALIETIYLVDRPELVSKFVFPISTPVKGWCEILNRYGCLHPAPLDTPLLAPIARLDVAPDGAYGALDLITKTANGNFSCAGWAVLPGENERADAVLLTYDNDQGQAAIFDLVTTGGNRPDVAKAFHQPGYSDSGFSSILKTDRLPAGTRTIRAWAFDAEKVEAFPLAGHGTIIK